MGAENDNSKQREPAKSEIIPRSLPNSHELDAYNAIVPGAAETIMAQFVAQGDHRRGQEAKIVDANITEVRAGQRFGITFALGALLVAGWCAYVGQPWPASIIGGGTLVTVVFTFIKGRKP